MADGDNNSSLNVSIDSESSATSTSILHNNENDQSRTISSSEENNVKSQVTLTDDKDKGDLPTATITSEHTEIEDQGISEKVSEVKEHDVPEDEIAQANKVEEELSKESDENDGWVKILGNDSLLKKVIKEGSETKRPLRGEICTVRLEGRLQSDDSIFEETESLTFQLGDAEVIPGLDLAVPLMCKGEVSHVKVASRFGYGAKGLPPVVPPNANLFYEVELIDFEVEKELETLTVAERKETGIRKRERGNWWYGREEPSIAIQCYRRALEFLDDVDGGISFPTGNDKTAITEELRQLIEDRLKTYNNMAAAQLKLQAYDAALTSVEAVLKCQPNNSKALFRKGKILTSKGDTEAALGAFKRVSELEPGTKAILQEINALQAKRKKEREGEKQLYQRMFKGKNSSESVNEDSQSSSTKRTFSLAVVIGGIAVACAGVMAYRYRFL